MTDPVTNALAIQLEYGEDELRQEIEGRIARIVREQIKHYLQVNSPDIQRQLLMSGAYDFNMAVRRALKDFINNPSQIY